MCGIAGLMYWDAARPVSGELLLRMTERITHRGPDGSGHYLSDGVGLGHRRLSIIDLATGDQPLGNEDGSIQVVFNGEIYNFRDVRRELEAHGHQFRTRSDTEIIVHGFEEWGEDCVTRFRGMFAFAVWDNRRRRLLLARDRLGVKPLYYALLPDGVVFGSEIKSLLEVPAVPREWDPEALDTYLTVGYIPAPRTIYRAVRKLDAAHTLTVEAGRASLRPYWDLHFTGTGDPAGERAYLDGLDALLDESVKLRLISDVPLGAFLSGGIDSSAVVSTMVRTSETPVLTVSVGFDAAGYDELDHACAVAAFLGCESKTEVVTPHVEDLLTRIAWHFDEPFADSSAVPTYYVSRAAREHVTVALSGDGGDELWAGYARHRVDGAERRARGLLGPLARPAGELAHILPLSMKGARSLRHLRHEPANAYALKHAYDYFGDALRHRCYAADYRAAVRGADPYATFRSLYARCESPDALDRALYVDIKTYLVEDILTKVDRMSMAVSLEAREPLLDHKLLEYVATIPSSLKLRDGTSKYLLRQLLRDRLPPSIVNRQKHGFTVPIARWLTGPLRTIGHDLLFDGRLARRGIFNEPVLRQVWNEHRSGRRDHQHRIWAVMMLELWFREFIDGAASPSAADLSARYGEAYLGRMTG